jgi:hypothetical protein
MIPPARGSVYLFKKYLPPAPTAAVATAIFKNNLLVAFFILFLLSCFFDLIYVILVFFPIIRTLLSSYLFSPN